MKDMQYDQKLDDSAIQNEEIEPISAVWDYHSNQRIERRVNYDFIANCRDSEYLSQAFRYSKYDSPENSPRSRRSYTSIAGHSFRSTTINAFKRKNTKGTKVTDYEL